MFLTRTTGFPSVATQTSARLQLELPTIIRIHVRFNRLISRGELDPANSTDNIGGEEAILPFQLEDADVLTRLGWVDFLRHICPATSFRLPPSGPSRGYH